MKHSIIPVLLVMGILASCAEVDVNKPRGSKETPAQVHVREVVNEAGRSIIYYDLPDDNNFKYVKAVYEPRPGIVSEARASFYTDSLIVEGFKEEGDYLVNLYSVSSGETESESIPVHVNPLRPPYLVVSDGAEVQAVFGGIKFLAENPFKERLYYRVEMKNDDGEWESAIEASSDNRSFVQSKRGLDPIETPVRFIVEDHWGNQSAPVESVVVPWEESLCDKSKFSVVVPPGEVVLKCYSTSKLVNAWDGEIFQRGDDSFQLASKTYQYPVSFTIDLGATYHLSRLEMWPNWRNILPFSTTALKEFECYGAETLDMDNPLFDEEGNLNPNWTLLFADGWRRLSGSFNPTSVEPLTQEERDIYNAGIPYSFDFMNTETKSRYFKFRVLSDYTNTVVFCIAELSLYGSVDN